MHALAPAAATAQPLIQLQQHVAVTESTNSAAGAGNKKEADEETNGKSSRNTDRPYRSNDYDSRGYKSSGYDSRDRYSSYSSRGKGKGGYGGGGYNSRNQAKGYSQPYRAQDNMSSRNYGRGNGVPCARHFGRERECRDKQCIRSHANEDEDECMDYRTSSICNNASCSRKHTPFNGQAPRVITAAPLQAPNLLQLVNAAYQHGSGRILNNNPGPPPGPPPIVVLPSVPQSPIRCKFFKKGTCRIGGCKMVHEL